MIRSLCLLVFVCWTGLILVNDAVAQNSRLLMVEDWTYDYIKRLQRRGHLLDLNPTAPPYTQGAVWQALENLDVEALSPLEARWVALLREELAPAAVDEASMAFRASLEAGARLINSRRLDVLRPLGDTLHVYGYLAFPDFTFDYGRFVAGVGVRSDKYYNDDPDGLDTALRALARSENTYLGYQSRLFSAYLGRFSNHWGVPGETAVLISNNPRSQDHLNLRVGGRRFSITGILSELDSITEDGRFTGRTGDDSVRVDSKRRYLAAHRWDWRPSRYLTITFMESTLYSGKNAGPSLKFFNPLQSAMLEIDNTPKNDENNGFVGGILWAHYRRLTLHSQLLFDDIDFLGIGNEPLSFALMGSLHYALPRADVDLGASLEMVAARTYNAPQTEGDYVYLLRGMATQFSDYIQASLYADLYLDAVMPGLRVTPKLLVLTQGAVDIRQPFPERDSTIDTILNGTLSRTVRPAVQLYYQRSSWWWVRVDGGVNLTTNEGHVAGANRTRLVGLVAFGVRLHLNRAYRLSL